MRASYIAIFATALVLAGLPAYAGGPQTGGKQDKGTKTKKEDKKKVEPKKEEKKKVEPKKEQKKKVEPKKEDKKEDKQDEELEDKKEDKQEDKPTPPPAPSFSALSYDDLKAYKPEISVSGKQVKVSVRMAAACSKLLSVDDLTSVKDAESLTVTKDTTKDALESARAEYGLNISFEKAEYSNLQECIDAHRRDEKVVKTISSNVEYNNKEAAKIGFLDADGKLVDEKSIKTKSSLDDLASKLEDLRDMKCDGGNCYTTDATRTDAISKLSSTISAINSLIKSNGLDGEVDMDPKELQKMLDAVLAAADSATDIAAIQLASKSLKEFSLKLTAIHNSKAAKEFDVNAAAKSLNDKQNELFAKAKALPASSEEGVNDAIALMSEIRDNQSKNPGLSAESKSKLWKEARALRQRGSDERLTIFKEKMPSHTEIREDRNLRINNYNTIVRPSLVNDYVASLNNYASRGCPVMQDQGSGTQQQVQPGAQPRKTAHMLPNVAAIQSSGNIYCAQLAAPLTNAYWALKNGDKALDQALAQSMADLMGGSGAGNNGVTTGPTAGTSNVTAVKVPQYEPLQNASLTAAIAAYNSSTVPTANQVNSNAAPVQPASFFQGNGLYNQNAGNQTGVPTATNVLGLS